MKGKGGRQHVKRTFIDSVLAFRTMLQFCTAVSNKHEHKI